MAFSPLAKTDEAIFLFIRGINILTADGLK
jgi:hypothetical protein